MELTNRKCYRWILDPQNLDLSINLYRLLLRQNEDVLLQNPDSTSVGQSMFSGPPEALKLMQESSFVNYASLSIKLRFRRAMSLEPWLSEGAGPEMFGVAMGGDRIDSTAYHLTDEHGRTLLSKVAAFMVVDIALSNEDNITRWREIIRGAVQAGADLCQISTEYRYYYTPLMLFFHSNAIGLGEIRRPWNIFHHLLQRWALELQAAGVDLAAYGAKESDLWKSGAVDTSFKVFVCSSYDDPFALQLGGQWLKFHLFSLSYGPSLEDWHVWFTNPVDELVGEFWEMIERKEEIMPGAWIE